MPTCFPFPRSLLALLDDEPKLILRVCSTVGNSSEVLVRILPAHRQTSFNNVGTRTGPERRTQQTRRLTRKEGRTEREGRPPLAVLQRGTRRGGRSGNHLPGNHPQQVRQEPRPARRCTASGNLLSFSEVSHRGVAGAQRRSSLVSVSPRRK